MDSSNVVCYIPWLYQNPFVQIRGGGGGVEG